MARKRYFYSHMLFGWCYFFGDSLAEGDAFYVLGFIGTGISTIYVFFMSFRLIIVSFDGDTTFSRDHVCAPKCPSPKFHIGGIGRLLGCVSLREQGHIHARRSESSCGQRPEGPCFNKSGADV